MKYQCCKQHVIDFLVCWNSFKRVPKAKTRKKKHSRTFCFLLMLGKRVEKGRATHFRSTLEQDTEQLLPCNTIKSSRDYSYLDIWHYLVCHVMETCRLPAIEVIIILC